jgi:hypothetical protein
LGPRPPRPRPGCSRRCRRRPCAAEWRRLVTPDHDHDDADNFRAAHDPRPGNHDDDPAAYDDDDRTHDDELVDDDVLNDIDDEREQRSDAGPQARFGSQPLRRLSSG